MNLLQRIGGPFLMLARATGATARRGVLFSDVVENFYRMANRSAWLVGLGMAFFGGVMVTIAQAQATKLTGNLTVIGPAYFELLVREFGPLIASLIAAARAAALESSELASMAVNEQVDALEMTAGDPLTDLVAPRVLAGLVAIPALCVLGIATATFAAAATAQWAYGANWAAFMDPRYLTSADVASAAIKSVACGLYIPLTASWRGLRAHGGSEAVGAATSEGVVAAVLGCLVIDLLLAVVFVVLFGA